MWLTCSRASVPFVEALRLRSPAPPPSPWKERRAPEESMRASTSGAERRLLLGSMLLRQSSRLGGTRRPPLEDSLGHRRGGRRRRRGPAPPRAARPCEGAPGARRRRGRPRRCAPAEPAAPPAPRAVIPLEGGGPLLRRGVRRVQGRIAGEALADAFGRRGTRARRHPLAPATRHPPRALVPTGASAPPLGKRPTNMCRTSRRHYGNDGDDGPVEPR